MKLSVNRFYVKKRFKAVVACLDKHTGDGNTILFLSIIIKMLSKANDVLLPSIAKD